MRTIKKYLASLFIVTLLIVVGCDGPMSVNDKDFMSPDHPISQDSEFYFQNDTDELIPGQYIVLFREGTGNVAQRANQMAQGVRGARGARGNVKHVYDGAVRGFTLTLPPQANPRAIQALQNNPNVALVEQDRMVRVRPNIGWTEIRRRITPPDFSTNSWSLDRIDQRYLPLDGEYTYQNNGGGVTVYVIDSGINYSHTDFGGRASFGFDAFGDDGDDCNGHGTHVAATIGGSSWGVAKGVNLVSVRVLGCDNTGPVSDIIAGINWVTANANGPSIANMSLGSSRSTAMDNAIRNSIEAGITYITSAGNLNANACNYSPSRVAEVITVGATADNDSRAWYSNHGSCVDIFAPGNSVVAAWIGSNDATASLDGTSMAAPHVAGTAAILLRRNPGITPSELFTKIIENSTQGIVSNSLSENNHLIYSYDTIYDNNNGSASGDGSGGDESSSGSSQAPVISSLTVSTSSNGPWSNAAINWSVSDADGDLSSVTSELFNGSSVVDSATSNVSGSTASSSHQLRNRGAITSVKLTVTDSEGNSTSQNHSF